MPRSFTILIVTGEASGDLHAARLVRELVAQDPSVKFLAVGGDGLEAAGATLLHRIEELSVVGITEVLRRLPRLLSVMNSLKARLRSGEIDLFILQSMDGATQLNEIVSQVVA